MSFNQCNTDSEKEIWITMFDEETTMDLFPTPPVNSPKPTNLQTLLKSAMSSKAEPIQEVNNKLSGDVFTWILQPTFQPDEKPLAEKAVQSVSFLDFKWQAMQTDFGEPLQQSVKRRLVL